MRGTPFTVQGVPRPLLRPRQPLRQHQPLPRPRLVHCAAQICIQVVARKFSECHV